MTSVQPKTTVAQGASGKTSTAAANAATSNPSDLSVSSTTPSAQVITLCELEQQDAQLSALRWGGIDGAAVNPLLQVKARLQVCVGTTEMTVAALLDAKENQIVQLDRMVDQPVDLMLEDKVIARGHLVAVDDRFGLRITELPVALGV